MVDAVSRVDREIGQSLGAVRSAVFFFAWLIAAPLSFADNLKETSDPEATGRLFQAVASGDLEAVRASLAAGADVTATNAEGRMPADIAVDLGHFPIAHYLLAVRTFQEQDPAKRSLSEAVKAVPVPGTSKTPQAAQTVLSPPQFDRAETRSRERAGPPLARPLAAPLALPGTPTSRPQREEVTPGLEIPPAHYFARLSNLSPSQQPKAAAPRAGDRSRLLAPPPADAGAGPSAPRAKPNAKEVAETGAPVNPKPAPRKVDAPAAVAATSGEEQGFLSRLREIVSSAKTQATGLLASADAQREGPAATIPVAGQTETLESLTRRLAELTANQPQSRTDLGDPPGRAQPKAPPEKSVAAPRTAAAPESEGFFGAIWKMVAGWARIFGGSEETAVAQKDSGAARPEPRVPEQKPASAPAAALPEHKNVFVSLIEKLGEFVGLGAGPETVASSAGSTLVDGPAKADPRARPAAGAARPAGPGGQASGGTVEASPAETPKAGRSLVETAALSEGAPAKTAGESPARETREPAPKAAADEGLIGDIRRFIASIDIKPSDPRPEFGAEPTAVPTPARAPVRAVAEARPAAAPPADKAKAEPVEKAGGGFLDTLLSIVRAPVKMAQEALSEVGRAFPATPPAEPTVAVAEATTQPPAAKEPASVAVVPAPAGDDKDRSLLERLRQVAGSIDVRPSEPRPEIGPLPSPARPGSEAPPTLVAEAKEAVEQPQVPAAVPPAEPEAAPTPAPAVTAREMVPAPGAAAPSLSEPTPSTQDPRSVLELLKEMSDRKDEPGQPPLSKERAEARAGALSKVETQVKERIAELEQARAENDSKPRAAPEGRGREPAPVAAAPSESEPTTVTQDPRSILELLKEMGDKKDEPGQPPLSKERAEARARALAKVETQIKARIVELEQTRAEGDSKSRTVPAKVEAAATAAMPERSPEALPAPQRVAPTAPALADASNPAARLAQRFLGIFNLGWGDDDRKPRETEVAAAAPPARPAPRAETAEAGKTAETKPWPKATVVSEEPRPAAPVEITEPRKEPQRPIASAPAQEPPAAEPRKEPPAPAQQAALASLSQEPTSQPQPQPVAKETSPAASSQETAGLLDVVKNFFGLGAGNGEPVAKEPEKEKTTVVEASKNGEKVKESPAVRVAEKAEASEEAPVASEIPLPRPLGLQTREPAPTAPAVEEPSYPHKIFTRIAEALGLKAGKPVASAVGAPVTETAETAPAEDAAPAFGSWAAVPERALAGPPRRPSDLAARELAARAGARNQPAPPADEVAETSGWAVRSLEIAHAVPRVPGRPSPMTASPPSILPGAVLTVGETSVLGHAVSFASAEDRRRSCIDKRNGTVLVCVEPVEWPAEMRSRVITNSVMYQGLNAVVRYDHGAATRYHALFPSEEFGALVGFYTDRFGTPTETWVRSVTPFAASRDENPTALWRAMNTVTRRVTVLEVRKFDDSRGGFPDTKRGALMLYYPQTEHIFPQVSTLELMRLRAK